jgi:hypothetical protein
LKEEMAELKPQMRRMPVALRRLIHQLKHDPPPIPQHWCEWFICTYTDLLQIVNAAADLQACEQLEKRRYNDLRAAVTKSLGCALELWAAKTPHDRKMLSNAIIAHGRTARRALLRGRDKAEQCQRTRKELFGPVQRAAPVDPIRIDNSFWQEPSEW